MSDPLDSLATRVTQTRIQRSAAQPFGREFRTLHAAGSSRTVRRQLIQWTPAPLKERDSTSAKTTSGPVYSLAYGSVTTSPVIRGDAVPFRTSRKIMPPFLPGFYTVRAIEKLNPSSLQRKAFFANFVIIQEVNTL